MNGMGLRSHLTKLAFRPHLPRRTVRLRLTLLYGGLFLLSGAGLLAITYVLVDNRLSAPVSISGGSLPQSATGGIVHGSPPASLAAQQTADLHQLLVQSAIALAIMAVVSIGLGWLVAGRVLRPIQTMTAITRRISERSLHERLALGGPRDELTDLGDTIDDLLGRLDTAFESQRRFVANASHELRTPLMLSQTLLQVALADPSITLDALKAVCHEAIDTGKEQAQLIDALLTLARSQRGLDHREPFDLAATVLDTLGWAHETASAKTVTLEATLDPAPVLGDPRLARRLVTNLVDNAIRYNHPDGTVEVITALRAGNALLRVTNTGPPVPGDQVDRLLQPFQRFDEQRSNDRDGLGLGLSIVSAVAAAHDARLSVRPQPTGGLAVEITFPSAISTEAGSQPPGTTRRNAWCTGDRPRARLDCIVVTRPTADQGTCIGHALGGPMQRHSGRGLDRESAAYEPRARRHPA
jgi:signal transduction histidine kinase